MKSKNTDQFLNLYNEFVGGVFRFCFYKSSDRDVALDLTQEIFTNIWQYMKKGGKLDNKKAFIYSTANRKVIDWYRTRKASISLDDLHTLGFDPPTDEPEIGLRIDGQKAFLKLKKLEDIYKEVLILRYVEELTIKEIAEALDETENNISVRIHRGLEKLRKIYEKEESVMDQKNKLKKNQSNE